MRSSMPKGSIEKPCPSVSKLVRPALVSVSVSPTAETTPTVLNSRSCGAAVPMAAQALHTSSDSRAAHHDRGLWQLPSMVLPHSDVERIGYADADGHLIRRTAQLHQRA